MDRRTFVKAAGASGIIILLPSSVVGCEEEQLEALRPWNISSDLPENTDIRLKLVAYAILAPSAHNKQSWIVDLRGEGIDLSIDPNACFCRLIRRQERLIYGIL